MDLGGQGGKGIAEESVVECSNESNASAQKGFSHSARMHRG